jgi:hypothetical protein
MFSRIINIRVKIWRFNAQLSLNLTTGGLKTHAKQPLGNHLRRLVGLVDEQFAVRMAKLTPLQ